MRRLKRFLIFATEAGLYFFAFVLATVVAVIFGVIFDTIEAGELGFCLGLVLGLIALFALRRKTRPWKIRYDADRWQATRARRKAHPVRARYSRIARRFLVWTPTAIAAFMLFVFPVASHILHPSSHYLPHYRVPIPWTATILYSMPFGVASLLSSSTTGKFGVTPFWETGHRPSFMSFGSASPGADFKFNHEIGEQRRSKAADISTRELFIGTVQLTCWQYRFPNGRGYRSVLGVSFTSGLWHIDCETPVDVHELNLSAVFHGREDDIPAFYKIVQDITPVP